MSTTVKTMFLKVHASRFRYRSYRSDLQTQIVFLSSSFQQATPIPRKALGLDTRSPDKLDIIELSDWQAVILVTCDNQIKFRFHFNSQECSTLRLLRVYKFKCFPGRFEPLFLDK